MNLMKEKQDNASENSVDLIVRELAVEVRHIAKSVAETQKQISKLTDALHDQTITFSQFIERENEKDRRLSALENSSDRQAKEIADHAGWIRTRKEFTKVFVGLLTFIITFVPSLITLFINKFF